MRLVILLASVLGLSASPLVAQYSVRVRWSLLDIVVRGDTGRPLMLIMSPSLGAQRITPGLDLRWYVFDPVDALQWSADVLRRLDTPPNHGVIGLPLWTRSQDMFLAVGIDSKAPAAERMFVALTDSAASQGLRAGGTADELRALLEGMFSISAWSVQQEGASPPRREGESPSCPAELEYLEQVQPDSQPRYVRSDPPRYPEELREKRKSGRVWLQLLIDTDGRVKPEATCVVLTDGVGFTQSAVRMSRTSRFKPAVRGGQPVPVLVILPVDYRVR